MVSTADYMEGDEVVSRLNGGFNKLLGRAMVAVSMAEGKLPPAVGKALLSLDQPDQLADNYETIVEALEREEEALAKRARASELTSAQIMTRSMSQIVGSKLLPPAYAQQYDLLRRAAGEPGAEAAAADEEEDPVRKILEGGPSLYGEGAVDVDTLLAQVENDATKQLVEDVRSQFEGGKVPRDIADFILNVDGIASKFDAEIEAAAYRGSFGDMMSSMNKSFKMLDKSSKDFSTKMELYRAERARYLGEAVKEEFGMDKDFTGARGESVFSGKPGEENLEDFLEVDLDAKALQNVSETLLSAGSALAAAWAASIICGWAGLETLYGWAPPAGTSVWELARDTGIFTAASLACVVGELALADRFPTTKAVKDEEMGVLSGQFQGVPTAVALGASGAMAYAETLIRGLGFAALADLASSNDPVRGGSAGLITPSAYWDTAQGVVDLKGVLGTLVMNPLPDGRSPTALFLPAVVLTTAAVETFLYSAKYAEGLLDALDPVTARERRDQARVALASSIVGAWASGKGWSHVSLGQISALRDTLLIDVQPQRSPTVLGMAPASVVFQNKGELEKLPQSRRELLQQVPAQAMRDAAGQLDEMVGLVDERQVAVTIVSQLVAATLLAAEMAYTRTLAAPAITAGVSFFATILLARRGFEPIEEGGGGSGPPVMPEGAGFSVVSGDGEGRDVSVSPAAAAEDEPAASASTAAADAGDKPFVPFDVTSLDGGRGEAGAGARPGGDSPTEISVDLGAISDDLESWSEKSVDGSLERGAQEPSGADLLQSGSDVWGGRWDRPELDTYRPPAPSEGARGDSPKPDWDERK